jgi:hypothetical protein
VRNSQGDSGITDDARRAETIKRLGRWRRTARGRRRGASSPASRRTSRRFLIGSDVRFMDLLLQRFRPAANWSVMARRIERMAKTAE